MRGRFKLPLWVLPLAMAGLVAAFGWWGNLRLRATIEGGLKAQLSATLNANVTALGIWSTNQTRLAMALADDPSVRALGSQILQTPIGRRGFQPLPEVDQFVSDLRPRLARLGYGVAQLVSTNFYVVANSSRPQLMGNTLVSDAHTNQFGELFVTGEPVMITPFKPDLLVHRRATRIAQSLSRTNEIRRRPALNAARLRRGDITLMQVAAPVRNAGGRIVGALALIINPDKEFSHILSVARYGASGETYAFDETGLMISHSRFDEQLRKLGLLEETNNSSALNLRLRDPGGDLTDGYSVTNEPPGRPLTRLVAGAVDGEDVLDVMPSRDYRGVPVVGASCWLPEFGFGVATQMDADEAYRPLHVLQFVFIILVLSLLLCGTALFIFSYANRAWRERLSAAELKLKQLGQYTLEEKIGEGGMGVVYRARHAMLRRDTAVKLLMPDRADATAIARFEREVCLTCQLTHPNTIQVYDYGHTPEGVFYYAMEFLRGVNLHDLVVRYGPQPESRVVHILAQVCDSLAEAHALGLIHRDIKPGNVFLCRRGGVPDCVKVLDFGLVRDIHAGEADTVEEIGPDGERVIEGTPWFTPPEAIWTPPQADPRSDLYALGGLGYFLLTGYYIFDAETVAEIHQKQLAAVPIPPSQRVARPISTEMEQLLLRCLEKDMNLRPQSARELRALLCATPCADEWTGEVAAAWWDACEKQPAAGPQMVNSAPLATVRIDLASRIE
jgi:eukaryotic-like serine/threonine-protein kinase